MVRKRQLQQQEYPDLILLDVRMPRMTGYDACKLIKADPELKDVPVVFLSAKGQETEIRDGMDAARGVFAQTLCSGSIDESVTFNSCEVRKMKDISEKEILNE